MLKVASTEVNLISRHLSEQVPFFSGQFRLGSFEGI